MNIFEHPKCVNFSRWLEFHEIAVDAAIEFCCSLPPSRVVSDEQEIVHSEPLSIEAAQLLIRTSFKTSFPTLNDNIDVAFENTKLKTQGFPDGLDPPYFFGVDGSVPTITIKFDGSPRAVIDLAHEYGHALQFHCAEGEQIAPIFREIFAFLGENALVDFAKKNDNSLAGPLVGLVAHDDEVYFGEDFSRLVAAARPGNEEYRYRWNYPIARHLALWITTYFQQEDIADLFLNSTNFSEIINVNEILRTSTSSNYLPQIGSYDVETPQSAYAQLGMMAMLDIDYWKGNSEKPMTQFYDETLLGLQNSQCLILLDAAKRPCAYATWNEAQEQVIISRQSAPFGDHVKLQKELQRRFDGKHIRSIHSRSSRKEQTAW